MPSPDDPKLPVASSGNALNVEERLALVRAVDVLFQKWEVTDFERHALLGAEFGQHCDAWNSGNIHTLSQETLVRLIDFVRIHCSLHAIFRDQRQRYGWIKRPNDALSGNSALEVMLLNGAPGIARVRAYLEAEVEA